MEDRIRIRLAEDDLDRVESSIEHAKGTMRTLVDAVKLELTNDMAGIRSDMGSMRTDMHQGFRECEARDDATRKLLTGLLISIVTLCVTVTAGVLVAVGGG